MAQIAASIPTSQHSPESTFRNYKPEQAQIYAASRPAYPRVLYEHILSQHTATGGKSALLIDVGCGPGNSIRSLAPSFDHAVGLDAGEGMINIAREIGGETKSGEKIRYEQCEAEKIASVPDLPIGSVDLITVATAAHWFDMKEFWPQAAQLLRPGGTVAIWIRALHYAHPSMPHAHEINEIQQEFWKAIWPHRQSGSLIAASLYDDLELPWTVNPHQTAFPQETYRRFDWDRQMLSDGEDFLGGSREVPVEYFEKAMSTGSAVTRWREAHPELEGTDEDVLVKAVAKIRSLLQGGGVRAGPQTALLIFKRA